MEDVILFFLASTMISILLCLRYVHYRRHNPIMTDKTVGPAYWGVYEGAPLKDCPSRVKIRCLKPIEGMTYTVGSARYASGNAVKSARG